MMYANLKAIQDELRNIKMPDLPWWEEFAPPPTLEELKPKFVDELHIGKEMLILMS